MVWALTLSFIIWNVWKERNKRIFKDEKNPSHHLFELILKQLKDTVGTTVRNHPKNPPLEANLRILRQLGMQGLISQGLDRKVFTMETEKDFWHPPLKGFLKYTLMGLQKATRELLVLEGF